jgi:hypothetical protein
MTGTTLRVELLGGFRVLVGGNALTRAPARASSS